MTIDVSHLFLLVSITILFCYLWLYHLLVVEIGFTKTSFIVMEDSGPVEVCVALFSMQTLLERDAVVLLQTMDGTAMCKTKL